MLSHHKYITLFDFYIHPLWVNKNGQSAKTRQVMQGVVLSLQPSSFDATRLVAPGYNWTKFEGKEIKGSSGSQG